MAVRAEAFLDAARSRGFALYSGVPCSYLQPLINRVIDDRALRYLGATNEGDAVAIASGAAVGGIPSVAMLQNSGLGNAVSPLTSLNAIFRVPLLLIVTLRGEPGGPSDEPQHQLMGGITTRLLELMEIPWEFFPRNEAGIDAALERACEHMTRARSPFALVMQKGAVSPSPLATIVAPRPLPPPDSMAKPWPDSSERPSREAVLRAVQSAASPRDALLATTGYTGRQLYALDDRPNQLYMVGSMGCVASFALGVSIAQPGRRVIVLDGDGAALMRMGALATIGYERPEKLLHILLDNEAHDSTGGQSTVSGGIDLGGVARACGYVWVQRATSVAELASIIAASMPGPGFVHVKIRREAVADLPRPKVTPVQVRERFQEWIRR